MYLPRLEMLNLDCRCEANRIDAAFIRFDYSGSGTLDESELAAMPLGILDCLDLLFCYVTKNRKAQQICGLNRKIMGVFPNLKMSSQV